MSMNKLVTVLIAASLVTGCATLQEVGRAALDKAQTISSALALRDGYLETKESLDLSLFSDEEQAILEVEAESIEAFHNQIVSLSKVGNTNELLVNADNFLTMLVTVRGSISNVIDVLEPKASQFTPESQASFFNAVANYRRLSLELDLALAKGSRQQAIDMTVRFLKSAIPVVTALLAR